MDTTTQPQEPTGNRVAYPVRNGVTDARIDHIVLALRKDGFTAYRETLLDAHHVVTNATVVQIAMSVGTATDLDLRGYDQQAPPPATLTKLAEAGTPALRTYHFRSEVADARINLMVLTLRKDGYTAYRETDRGIETVTTNASIGEVALSFGTASDLFLNLQPSKLQQQHAYDGVIAPARLEPYVDADGRVTYGVYDYSGEHVGDLSLHVNTPPNSGYFGKTSFRTDDGNVRRVLVAENGHIALIRRADAAVGSEALPPFQHHAEYDTVADMDEAARLAGYTKVQDGQKHHYEKPPGDGIFWTRKMGFSRVGGLTGTSKYGTYSYA